MTVSELVTDVQMKALRWRWRDVYVEFTRTALIGFQRTNAIGGHKDLARMAFDLADTMLLEMNVRMERRHDSSDETPPKGTRLPLPGRRAEDRKQPA